jgi:hypothetical protein
MNSLKSFLLITVLTWFLTLFLPWWSIILPALLVGAWKMETLWLGFGIGFLASASAWWAQAWITSFQNNDLLSSRLSLLLFQVEIPGLFIFATGLMAGLIGALSAITGIQLRKLLAR